MNRETSPPKMNIVEATNDFLDWELLQTNSDSELAPISSLHSGNSLDEIDSGGLIQANYFSLDSQDRHGEGVNDEKSSESDNPSWIDPGLEEDPTRYLNKEPVYSWSDSTSERSEDRKISELEGTNEMGFSDNEKKEPKFEGIVEVHQENGKEPEELEKFYMDSSGIGVGPAKLDDSAENSQVNVEGSASLHVEAEALGEEKNENEKTESGGEAEEDATRKRSSGELEKRSIVWWKMPMDFLKYCVLRMSPVWTVSIAAAFMGFVILGRRLYKMKKNTRGLEIKVTVDDKKVSQVMSRAARLNEAFLVVKRVPVVRPSLPAVGSNSPWPAMSMR